MIRFLSIEELLAEYIEDHDTSPVTMLTPGEVARLSDCARITGGAHVWRDWEGSLTVWFPNERARESMYVSCVLSVSPNGRIAHYDCNQPRYYDNLPMLIFALRTEVHR